LRLRKFRVQAFRCIHDSGDIVVGDLAAFVGRNESGKTTILQALTMLNRDETISELDLCDEMTERLKSEIRIVEGDFELNHDETEIVKERFPDFHITKLKIFRTNKDPEIQYDFGDIKIGEEEDKNLEYWQTSTKQLSNFVESIPNYISKKLDTDFFTGNTPKDKKIIQAELDEFDNSLRDAVTDEQQVISEWEKVYADITKNVKKNIKNLKINGKKLIGYGSPAKATTALNFFGISNEIEYIVEDNKLKHGKFLPGMKIPIISKENVKGKPDYALVLAWNFLEEIKKKNSDLAHKFISIKDLEI